MDAITANRQLNTEEIKAGKVVLDSKPLQINVELTGVCNIIPPCVFCTGKNFGHNYPHLDWQHIEDYAPFTGVCEQLNEDSFGEPLTHPRLVDLAQKVTGRGQRFSFVTNGLLLDARRSAGLVECGPKLGLHVSFNATTPDTYFKLHGRSYERVLENVIRFISLYKQRHACRSPDLTITFIVMQINRHEVLDFLRLAYDLDVRALLAPLHDRPSIPLGKFGYDFVYEAEILPPDDYKVIGEEARAFQVELEAA